jgi:hypothetical protein
MNLKTDIYLKFTKEEDNSDSFLFFPNLHNAASMNTPRYRLIAKIAKPFTRAKRKQLRTLKPPASLQVKDIGKCGSFPSRYVVDSWLY